MPNRQKYSNDQERLEARRAQRRKYYAANRDRQLVWNMRYRHKTNPPLYIQETQRLKEEIERRRKAFETREKVLLERLAVLEGWDPLKPAAQKNH